MKKTEVIENLYAIFKKYTASNMHYCDCGCIDPDDVKKLASKKLKDLKEDDFSSYHGSALYTWGDVDHYKHFLPRVLEVHRQKNGYGLIGLSEITAKLEYANWQSWDEKEISAIENFILMDWDEFINKCESDPRKDDLEYYSFFFDLNNLISKWNINIEGTGLRNFVIFWYYEGTEIVNKGFRIKDKSYDAVFTEFINQENLIGRLEEEYFKVESENSEYAEKVSIVTQMIEQERKTVGNKK